MPWTGLRTGAGRLVLCAAAAGAVACGEPAPEPAPPASEEASPVDLAALAQALSEAGLDSITWSNPETALRRGEVVYRYSCEKCHGVEGRGDAGFVMAGDTLRPRSFLGPDWPLAGDIEAIRLAVFVGTDHGMPHWGLLDLKSLDIDAVARYIDQVIRKPR